jgi:hypothetical protein
MNKQLLIDLPETAYIPEAIAQDQDHLRYLLAGTLYTQQLVSELEARRITGDPRRVFQEKMNRYGFCLMPESDHDIEMELSA